MPRVPTYETAQVQQQPTRPIQLQGVAPDTTSIGQGLQAIGRGAQMLMDKEREKADTALLMDADNQLTKWQQQAMYSDGGVYTRKGQNALDVTNQTLDQFEKAQAEIAKTLTNDQQKTRYAQIVNSRRNSLSSDLNRYEYGERQNYYGQVEKAQLETSMQGAALEYQDPAKVDQYRQKVDSVLSSRAERLGLSPEAAQAERLETNSGMSTAVIQRMLIDSPQKAKSYYESYKETMTAEDQIRTSNGIDQGFRRLEAEARQRQVEARQMQAINRMELSSRVQDASAAYSQGLQYENPPSKADFESAMDKGQAAKAYSSFQKVQEAAPVMQELRNAPASEWPSILERFQPAPRGVAGEGFKESSEIYQHLVSSGQSFLKQRESDPADYVMRSSPVVQRAFSVAQDAGTPEAYQAFARASLAEQDRLGITTPKLLPDAQADRIVAQFADVSDGGTNAAEQMQQLQGQWGKFFPQVFSQMQKKLPASALVIGTGVDPATSAILARTASLKNEELKAGLLPENTKAARDELNTSMTPFRATLAQQVGGERTFSTIYGQAERLAYVYMGQGKAPKDAVAGAVAALVDDKYTLKGTYRVPAGIDADLIERGASLAKASVNVDDLDFAIPKGLDSKFALGRVKGALNSDGYWVTTPDESGLALYFGGAAILDKQGRPVTRTFDELTSEAIKSPSGFQRFKDGALGEPVQRPNMPEPYYPWSDQ